MVRIVVSVRVLVVVALTGVVSSAALCAGGGTSVRIVLRATPAAPARVTTLRCNPPSGSVAHPAQACSRLLAAGRAIFAPTPPGSACTQIYGGPQEAIVTGTLHGMHIWARFRRRDGCELARWHRVAFLLS